MAKSPAFSLYPRDILADTLHLTTEQFGAYCKLLFVAWIGVEDAPQGFLPVEDRLPALAGVAPRRWRKIGAPVLALFKRDDAGRLFHGRLLKELERQRERSTSARDSARRRWEKGERSHSPRTDSALRSHSDGNAAREAADANADADAKAGKREREGERVLAGPDPWGAYRRLLVGLYPPARLPGATAGTSWEAVDDALLEASGRDRLPAPLDFGIVLWRWAHSDDWAEQDGRFVPTPEVWIRRDCCKSPRRFPEHVDPGGWRCQAEVVGLLGAAA